MQKTLLKSLILFLALTASNLLLAANISKQQAVKSALAFHSGRVLSIKLSNSVYKVKVISTSGQVRVVRVNAKSGQIIR
jgi:uncharacterized membrane protein YkoI